MNILFYHYDETCPTMGGIQRTTDRIATELTNKFGHKCYNIHNYTPKYDSSILRHKYQESRSISHDMDADEIASILKDWNIDIIVNQMGVHENPILAKAISLSNKDIKLWYFHHNTPQRLFPAKKFSDVIKTFKTRKTPALILRGTYRILEYPIYRIFNKRTQLKRNARNYRKIYDECDLFVLLSEQFYPEFLQLTEITDKSKLRAIPNMLSFEKFADETTISNKQKKILFVARLTEFPKKCSWALKIWEEITKDPRFDGWSFDIVGHGREEQKYANIIQKRNIPRVTMHGRQNSEPFYENASIFMMTSIREGFPMTLLESIQKGCVPIAFDSFASVHDIIIDNVTGKLVPAFDIKKYIESLKDLMLDNELRNSMAINGIKHAHNFTAESVARQWQNLIENRE